MNNAVFGKTMENVQKHRDFELLTTNKKEINQHQNLIIIRHNILSENVLAIEMKKAKVKMNKPVHLCMSILDVSKTLMYEFWYGYV